MWQSIQPGTSVEANTRVDIKISTGPEPEPEPEPKEEKEVPFN